MNDIILSTTAFFNFYAVNDFILVGSTFCKFCECGIWKSFVSTEFHNLVRYAMYS